MTTVVLDNDVLHCVVGYRETQYAVNATGGGGGGDDGGGLPAWGWVLIGLGIAAILAGALLPILLHRRRKRRAAAAKQAGVGSPAGPASLQNVPLDTEDGLKV